MDAPLALAFATGMLATFNPCGFAMLPAYLGWFVGFEDDTPDTGARILRALAVGGSVTAGFAATFAVAGTVLSGVESVFEVQTGDKLPWLTIPIGLALVVLGVSMLAGRRWVLRLPHLDRGTGSRQASSMFVFGVSYAVTSFSCTWPLFVTAVSGTFGESGFVAGLAVYLLYGLGMGLVLMVLTLAIALARRSVVDRARSLLRHVDRLSGALLVVAGAYVAYYGWYELQVLGGDLDPAGPGRWVTERNSDLKEWLDGVGPTRIGLVLGGVVAAALIVAVGLWSDRRAAERSGTTGGGPAPAADPEPAVSAKR